MNQQKKNCACVCILPNMNNKQQNTQLKIIGMYVHVCMHVCMHTALEQAQL